MATHSASEPFTIEQIIAPKGSSGEAPVQAASQSFGIEQIIAPRGPRPVAERAGLALPARHAAADPAAGIDAVPIAPPESDDTDRPASSDAAV